MANRYKIIHEGNKSEQIASAVNSAASKTTPVDADEMALIDSQASNVLKKLSWSNLKATVLSYLQGIPEILLMSWGGWVDANETWTYASSTSFTISGDKTGKYQKGDKIKLTNDGSVKYFYITDVTYSSPNTTVTVTPKAGGANLVSGAISNCYFSKAANPQGFEQIDTTGIADGAVTLDKTLNLVGCNANQIQIRYGTYVTTTNASGEATVVYPESFPNGTHVAVAINGDSGVGNIIYHIKRPHSATGFTVVVRVADSGALFANRAVRIDYIAIGY